MSSIAVAGKVVFVVMVVVIIIVVVCFPDHVRTPEVGDAVAEDIVRFFGIIAGLSHQFNDFQCGLLWQGLPQTSHETRHQRRRERCAHVSDDAATA